MVAPLPVLLLQLAPASSRTLAALRNDSRFESIDADRLTPEVAAASYRVAATFVIADAEPLGTLVYAVTGGISGRIVVVVPAKFRKGIPDALAGGAAAAVTMPLKPHDLSEIAAALAPTSPIARVDGTLRLILDPVARTARLRDRWVGLSKREFEVLQVLSSYEGRPVAAQKLVARVWGARETGSRPRQILDVYVHQLRRKLGRLGLVGAIATVRGVGYRLVQGSRAP